MIDRTTIKILVRILTPFERVFDDMKINHKEHVRAFPELVMGYQSFKDAMKKFNDYLNRTE